MPTFKFARINQKNDKVHDEQLKISLFLIVFITVVCVARFIFFYIRLQHQPDLPINPDTSEYLVAVPRLLDHGSFSNPDGSAYSLRPPGYSLVIAGVFGLFGRGNFLAVVLLQNVAFLICALIVAKWALRFGNAAASNIATMFYVTDVITFYYTNAILTESFFVLLLCLSVALLAQGYRSQSGALWLFAAVGFLIACATYLRIAGMFLIYPLAVLIAAIEYARWKSWPAAWTTFFIVLAPSILLVGGWSLRNYWEIGRFVFETHEPDLFIHRSLGLIAAMENVDKATAYTFLTRYLGPGPYSAAVHLGFYFDHLSLFVREVATDLAITLFAPGQWHIPFYVPDFPLDRRPLTPFVRDADTIGLWNELSERGIKANLILFYLLLHTTLLYVGVIWGAISIARYWRSIHMDCRYFTLFTGLFFAYFLGQLVFWEGATRFRIPIFPFLVVLCGYGYSTMLLQLSKRRRERP